MSQPESDESLLKRASDGDRDAFAVLVERHQARVRLWIAQLVSDREDAYDLAQEVFLAVWQAVPRFQPGQRFLPWMRAIARHRLADPLRRRYRRQRREPQLLEEALVDLACEDPS
ncbi:MAG: RNA polymerase sigma factor, partial [Planctomycetota bacterium]